MYELFMMMFDANGLLSDYIASNPELYDYLLKRAFEGSMVFYLAIFLVLVYICYRVFRNFWKS